MAEEEEVEAEVPADWIAGLRNCHRTTKKKACERMSSHVAPTYSPKLVRPSSFCSCTPQSETGTISAETHAKASATWRQARGAQGSSGGLRGS